jgi:hypothetical protein
MIMGGWIVDVDGERIIIPNDVDWQVPDLEGRLPDQVMLTMDEWRFTRSFARHAESELGGQGNYATLSYCTGAPGTVMRHMTLPQAIRAKQQIDNTGCGGGCCFVHLIVEIDPSNSRAQRQQDNARKYRDAIKQKEANDE